MARGHACGFTGQELTHEKIAPMGLIDDIEKGQRMSGSSFVLRLHCTSQGDSPADLWDFTEQAPLPGWEYVGWCPSGATEKPDSGWPGMDHHVAVMLQNAKEEEVWLHVPVTRKMLDAISPVLYRSRT